MSYNEPVFPPWRALRCVRISMKPRNILLIIILVGLSCLVLAACCAGILLWVVSSQEGDFDFMISPQTGQIAPGFQLEIIDGEKITLQEFHSKPVMVNFWAVWCDPCLEEMLIIQERYQRYKPDLVVSTIELNGNDADVREFFLESGLSFKVLGGNDTVLRKYYFHTFPTSIFIDKNDGIQFKVVGSLSGLVWAQNW